MIQPDDVDDEADGRGEHEETVDDEQPVREAPIPSPVKIGFDAFNDKLGMYGAKGVKEAIADLAAEDEATQMFMLLRIPYLSLLELGRMRQAVERLEESLRPVLRRVEREMRAEERAAEREAEQRRELDDKARAAAANGAAPPRVVDIQKVPTDEDTGGARQSGAAADADAAGA